MTTIEKDWDYSGYPPELRLLLELLVGDIDELFLSLLAGELGLLPWQAEMELLLGRYHLATFLKGAGLKKVSENQMKYIMNVLAEQFEYLDNFVKTMAADIKALLALPEEERPPLKTILEKYQTRAGMYGRSATQEYWTGVTGGVPLPAMPGDGSSQCLTSCKCNWYIEPINAKNGDFDAYWRMGDAEHCQTCQVRAADWNPLRIRNWEYRLPSQRVLTEQLAEEVAEAGVGAGVKSRRKHLPGQHQQKLHGNRGGSITVSYQNGTRTVTKILAIDEDPIAYHGTYKDSAENIKAKGFVPSKGGTAGEGVYLSRNEKDTLYERDPNRSAAVLLHGGRQPDTIIKVKVTGLVLDVGIMESKDGPSMYLRPDIYAAYVLSGKFGDSGFAHIIIKDNGYVGISWKWEDGRSSVIIFDPENVSVDQIITKERLKHLPGQHDQKRHGWRYNQ